MSPLAKARFSQLVLPRLDEAYRLARWLTGSATDAEDVVQEACLRAFRSIESFAEGNARGWFLTILRNTCYSWLASHRPRSLIASEDLSPAQQHELESGGVFGLEPQTPESVLIAKSESGQLARAIDLLPLPLKEALVLREHHGLSYREIAEVCGVPVGTVMSRLARARQKLAILFDTEPL